MSNFQELSNAAAPAFDVDGTLGGLAKWLRILGFDATYPRPRPSAGRVFVTTKRRYSFLGTVVITEARPLRQLRELLDQIGIEPDPELFLSRCLVCNALVHVVPKEEIRDRVPARVFEITGTFSRCPDCGRIYWEGSHAERIKRRLEEDAALSTT